MPKAQAAPDPAVVKDADVMEGPHAIEIAKLLDELTKLAEVEWRARKARERRGEIFARLDDLKVTMYRARRAYAVNGRPIITHVGIINQLQRLGRRPAPIKNKTKESE